MEELNIALQTLRHDLSSKGEMASATDSLQQLKFVSDTLETSPMPSNMFKKLSFILRRHMIYPYQATPKSALQYAVAVLAIISNIKARSDTGIRAQWDNTQDSLLSGILDFLEQNATTGNQSLVASFLYMPLCGEFFPSQDKPIIYARDNLLCTVFQLLSETAFSHPINQHKLRDSELLGGRRLGLMLAQCKDFLAIEALLELVGNIIPSARKHERRSRFIENVFNPKRIRCDTDITRILERATSAGWDSISGSIFGSLAKSNIAYPQPFETTQIRTTETSYAVSRIYIDKSAFTASVDKDGKLETFKIPFCTVQEIRITASSASIAKVVAVILAPPLLGHALAMGNTDKTSVDFDIEKGNVNHFIKVLRQRGLKNVAASDFQKQSMAETHVNLAFQSIETRKPPPLEEKIENLSRLWTSQDLLDEPYHGMTSPLHKVAKSDDTTIPNPDREASSMAIRVRDPVELYTFVGAECNAPPSIQTDSRLDSFFEATNKEPGGTQYKEDLNAVNRQTGYARSSTPSRTPNGKKVHTMRSICQTGSIIQSNDMDTVEMAQKDHSMGQLNAADVISRRDEFNALEYFTDAANSDHPFIREKPRSRRSRMRLDVSNEAKTVHIDSEFVGSGKPGPEHGQTGSVVKVVGDAEEKEHSSAETSPILINLIDKEGAKVKPLRAALLLHTLSNEVADVDAWLPGSRVPVDGIKSYNGAIATAHNAIEGSDLMGKPTYERRRLHQEKSGAKIYESETLHRDASPGRKEEPNVAFVLPPASNIQHRTSQADLQNSPLKSQREQNWTSRKNFRTEARARKQERYPRKPIIDCPVASLSTHGIQRSDRTCAMDNITGVLEQIHEAITTNVVERFDDVRKDIHLTQGVILEATGDDLSAMHARSMRHYEQLVDLANEYATHAQKTTHAVGQSLDGEITVMRCIKDIIREHDRRSLSSKFPDVVSPAVPACFDIRGT